MAKVIKCIFRNIIIRKDCVSPCREIFPNNIKPDRNFNATHHFFRDDAINFRKFICGIVINIEINLSCGNRYQSNE